jgi:predicted transcriptional regulator
LFPDEFVIVLKECSPKAIYYAVKSGISLDGVIIYFDDVPDNPETVKVLKDLASNNIISPRLWSVSAERDLLDVKIEGHIVIFASAVESLSDKADQFLRRYLILNPDENPDINEKVMEKIKRDIRFGQQGTTWLPEEDLKIAKEIVRQIKACEDSVTIPFDFEFPTSVVTERTNLKQFAALLCAITKTRFAQRLSIDGNLLAQPEDFDEAVRLWNTRQPEKVDVVALKVLKLLGDQEPQEMKIDKESVWEPEPQTSTTLAKELKLAPRRVNEKLNHLYDQGFVDRKAVSGRGNPYAYWISSGKINPTTQGISELPKTQAAIRLKDPKTSSDDYYGATGLAGKEPELMRIYMERMDKYLEKYPLSTEPVSAVIIGEKKEPRKSPDSKRKASHLGVQKTLEKTSPTKNEENSGVQNSTPPKSPGIITEEIKAENESIHENSPNDLGENTKPESSRQSVMLSVKDWCKTEQVKNGTSEISLVSLQNFIEKTLKIDESSDVVKKALDLGIIQPYKAGMVVVV